MQRVGVLIDKLQEQLQGNADVQHMLATAQLLHRELFIESLKGTASEEKKAVVFVPHAIAITPEVMAESAYKPVPKPESEPAPVAEPMPETDTPLPETEPSPTPKPEPEPIPHFVEQRPWNVFPPKPENNLAWALDPVLEIPTLAQQEKVVYELKDSMVDEMPSLNERLKQNTTEMNNLLKEPPIRDLKKAITINDRHRFIHELFRDDENMYERSIKTINSFNIFAEAEYWIQRELKVKLGWDVNLDLVKTFDQLVKRRFS